MSISERFVAVCDVLGLSDLVRTTDLTGLSNRYRGLTRTARPKNWQITLGGQFDDRGRDDEYEETIHTQVGYVVFSDTLLMWSEADKWSVQALFEHLTQMISESVQAGLPLRMGIGFGQCDIDVRNNIYLGKAIVDAHNAEKTQLWVGGACHSSCESAPLFSFYIIEEFDMVVEYNVPTRRTKDLTLALNWVTPRNGTTNLSSEFAAHIENAFAKAPSEEARLKWSNTRKFFNSQLGHRGPVAPQGAV